MASTKNFDKIKLLKKSLRLDIKKRIKSMSDEEINKQSSDVTEKLITHPNYVASHRVSVYLSMAGEVKTNDLLENIFTSGKKCYVPQYIGDNMRMLRLFSMADYDSLPLTKWNINQPGETDIREEALETGGLDLIIVPGLGFTSAGLRLGRGKGYYDSYLKKCRQISPSMSTIALAFSQQICEEIPTHEHDMVIDTVLYPDE